MNPLISLKEKAFTKYVTEDNVGAEKRKANRQNQNKKAIRKGISIFEKFFPKAFLSNPVLVDFTTQWEKLYLALIDELPGKKDLVIAHNEIAKAIDLGTKKGLWSVSVPTQLSLLKREKPFKNQRWFNHAKILQEFESYWLSRLDKTDNSNELLTRCIYSAMFHSGLNDPLHINALIKNLQQKQPLQHVGEHYWITLHTVPEEYVKSHKNNKIKFPFSTNNKIDGKEIVTTRFYPTTSTLAFIHNYLNNRKAMTLEPPEFWKALINTLKKRNGERLTERQICQGAVSVSEIKPNVRCPEAIVEYMTKRNMSYSLPCNNWDKIGGHQAYIRLDSLTSFKSLIGGTGAREIKAQPVKSTFGLIADLRSALATHKNKKVLSHQQIIMNITACLDIDAPDTSLHEKILVHWLLTFLKSKNATSTPLRYFTAIGAIWISNAEQVHEDQPYIFFEDLYLGLLELATSDKSRAYIKGRLIDLHRFAVVHYNFPKLVTLSNSGDTAVAHVRASFVSESMFKALLDSVNKCKSATKTEVLLISTLLILAYRTGLRLGEVLKLRRSDLEYSADGWLFIRDNLYDKNKTAAARRKVPLITLLTPAEVRVFKNYLISNNMINSVKSGSNKLLFSFAINEATPIDKFMVSNLVSQVLKEISQIALFVFHCLRHSAFSRLQVLIDYHEFNLGEHLGEFKNEIIPYEDEQISLICSKLIGENKLKKYNAIASLAGHSATKTTFNSYFHFTDFIMYCALNMNEQELSVEQVANLSGLSKRSLSTISPNGKTLKINQVQPLLLHKVQRKPYCRNTQIKQPENTIATIYVKPEETKAKKFVQIYQLLSTIEKGENTEYLMWVYTLTKEQLDIWVKKAELIKGITTTKNKSRNIASNRTGALLTPLPAAQADINEITHFRTNLREKYQRLTAHERKANSLNICRIIFCRSNTSSSGIIFRHPSRLLFFLNFMSYFPKNRWFISINASSKKDIKDWKNATKGYNIELNTQFTQDKRNPNGQAKLHLLSKQQPFSCKENDWKKYSVNTIKYVMHIIAISELSAEDIEEMMMLI